MKTLGFLEMTRPLRWFMAVTNQFRPPPTLGRKVYWVFTNGTLVLTIFLALMQLVLVGSSELGSTIEIIIPLITLVENTFRALYLCYRQQKLFDLMAFCQNFPVSCPAFEASESTLKKRAFKRSHRVQLLFSGFIFLIVIGFLVLPFIPREIAPIKNSDIKSSIVSEYPLFIPMWLPLATETVRSTPIYQIIISWQGMGSCFMICIFCSADFLIYSFAIFITEGMKHLERITPNPPKNDRPKRGRRYSLNIVVNEDQPVEEYKILIQQHQFLIELAVELDALFSPIIFTTYMAHTVVLCIQTYVLSKLQDLVGIICVTGHLSCILIKLYLLSSYGQDLMNQTDRLKTCMPAKIWPRLGDDKMQDAQIVSHMCHFPVALTGLKLFNLKVALFGKVFLIAFCYFLVLMQFRR